MKHLSQLPLFQGMEESEYLQMIACLQSNPRTFHAGETAYTYGSGDGQTLGLVQEGQAVLVKIDARGSRTILERLGPGGIFGEGVAFASLPCDSVTLVCETACTVLFLPRAKLAAPCAKACGCHHQLLENLLGLLSHKAFALSERVEVLSCRSIRVKLLCTFRICAFEAQSLRFTLPFSLSALADYICADRSAMMRELKKLKEEGVVETTGRQIAFLSSEPFGKADLCAASWKE